MDKENRNTPKGGPHVRIAEKPKNFSESISKLITKLQDFKISLLIAIILALFSSILTIIGPNRISDMTDTIVKGLMGTIDMDRIKSIAIFLGIIFALSAIFNFIQSFIMATVSNKFSRNLRREISSKINRLPLKYFDNHAYGDVLSRVTNDVDSIAMTMNQSVATLVSALTLFLGCILMMFITNWILAITAILSTVFGFLFMTIVLSKSQKYFKMQQESLGDIEGHIEEIYSGHNVVRVYNGIEESNKKFDEINDKLFLSARKSQFLSGLMQPMMLFIGNFGYVSVCVVGALLTMNGTITFGVIVAFMIYVRLFSQPLSQIAQAMTNLQTCAAAAERVFEFLDEEEMTDESKLQKTLDISKVKGDIKFNHVKFGYDDKIIINDFSADIKAGSKIALVGPTGAGKTTMVNLLMKFYDIKDGDIKIDGISTKELTRENIHDLFIMVLQDTWLFEGTIKENIVYNKPDVALEEVKVACKIVGLDHYIKTLPEGYNTIITDNDSLSAGEKQLLTIARGMIKNSPFLILDEATSSVDTRTEELVQKAMDKLMKGRTSFIIAHRLSTIKNADLILVLKDGNIIEQGNHNELMNKKGFYAELYNSQFQK